MSEQRVTNNADNRAAGDAVYLQLAELAFVKDDVRMWQEANLTHTNGREVCPTPEVYERWLDLCSLIARGDVTEPEPVAYLQGDDNE